MEFFFNPKAIALIGATANRQKVGYAILSNLRNGYSGKIFPVNPRYSEIEGLPCYPSVSEIPESVDLAIVFVPAARVPDVVDACARLGIPGVMIESGGFAETGKQGEQLQASLNRIQRETGIRLWGPNCMGLFDAVNRRIFSFVLPTIWQEGLVPGNVSLIVQSGLLAAGFLIHNMTHGIMGIGKACSLGNKIDVDECDVLEYLIQDPQTDAIGLYLESVVDGRRFMNLCQATDKPMVMLKGGKSDGGAAAAMSHTASLSGNHAVLHGALAQAGIVEVDDFQQIMDVGRTLARYPDHSKNANGRIVVLTYSGAAGIVSADFIDNEKLRLADLAETTLRQLGAVFPEWMPVSNPVDLWPAMERHGMAPVLKTAIEAACADPGVDAVLLHSFIRGVDELPDFKLYAEQIDKFNKPIFCWMVGSATATGPARELARENGIPVFDELSRAVECMAAVFQRRPADVFHSDETIPFTDGPLSAHMPEKMIDVLNTQQGALDEYLSKEILSYCHIPVVEEKIAGSVDAARAIGEQLGFPVVIKGMMPGLMHKTESGLVRTGIQTPEAVGQTYREFVRLMEKKGSVLIQRQIPGEVELIAGLIRDLRFGPCVMCGWGGIYAELLGDIVFAVAPFDHQAALALIGRLKHQALMDGFRGLAPLDRDLFADILVSIGELGLLYERIQEIDINPLIVSDGRPVAVDASFILK